MAIHTVLGPIEPDQLGPTSMHEHLLSDLSIWSKPSAEPVPEHDALHPGMTGYLRWNALAVPENLVLHDPDVAIAELAAVRAAGGSRRGRADAGGDGPADRGAAADLARVRRPRSASAAGGTSRSCTRRGWRRWTWTR